MSEHSYAEGGFSTQTTFFDTSSGEQLGEMEQFAVNPRRRTLRIDRLQLLGRHLRAWSLVTAGATGQE